jgi:hypothetical protein
MSIRTEFVDLLAEKMAEELAERQVIEVPKDFSIKSAIFEALDEEIRLEDKINEEVRGLLNEYGNQMRESGASYQEMFKLIKRKLVRERKVIL